MQKKSKKFVPSSNPDDLRNWKWRNAIYIYLYKLACIFLLLYNQVKIALKNGFFWYTHTQIKYLFIIISFLANGNRNFSLSEAASVTSGYGNNKQRQLKLCKPPKEQKKKKRNRFQWFSRERASSFLIMIISPFFVSIFRWKVSSRPSGYLHFVSASVSFDESQVTYRSADLLRFLEYRDSRLLLLCRFPKARAARRVQSECVVPQLSRIL